MKKASRRARLSKIISAVLILGVVSIVPSAFWLPAAPANAASGGIAWWWINQGGGSSTQSLSVPSPASFKASAFTTCANNPINFNWGSFGPVGCGNGTSTANSSTGFTADNFSTYGEGYIQLPNISAGSTVTFYDSSDDGFYMYMNPNGAFDQSNNIISNWVDQGSNTYNGTGSVTLSATCSTTTFCPGGVYPIQIFHHENGGSAAAQLYWSYTGVSTTLVPGSSLSTAATDLPTAQTITFAGPSTQIYSSGLTVSLSASASSGLSVSFSSSTTSVCTVSGSSATIVSAGTCTIVASQAGNSAYSAASSVTRSFAISQATLAAPTSITATPTAGNTTTATLTFASAANASSTTVRIWSASTGGVQVGSDWTSFTSGGSITGLSPSTTYYAGLTSIGTGNYANSSESTRVAFTTNTAASTPIITTQPINLFKTSPQAASLMVAATGNGTLTYQWQVKVGGTGSFANVTYGSGGTTSSYALDVTRYTNGDQYQVIVTNTLNGTSATATSTTATLTLASALSITTPSTGLNAVAGTPFSLYYVPWTTGGRTPYTFSNTGTLPAGITLTNSTSGIISGTPTTVGTSTFTTTVTDSNSATATTNSYSIVVSPGPTTTLLKTQVISSTSASGATISTQPTFTLQDTYGNTATNDAGAVVVAIYSGTGGTLRGTTSVTPISGVATFSGLILDGVNNTSYVLSFSHSGAVTAYETITATTGAATQLVRVTGLSTSSVAGARLTTQPVVYIEDSGGNVVNSTAQVSINLASGTGGTFSGTTSMSAVAGVATFTDLTLGGTSGTPYGFQIASSGLTSTSMTITLVAGPTYFVTISTPAAGFPNGVAAIVQPVITLTDAYGNVANNTLDTITATVSSDATLIGTTTVLTSSGTATFTNLGISGSIGSQYSITFTSALSGRTSTQVQVLPESAIDAAMTFDGSTSYAATSSLTTSQVSATTTSAEVWVNPSVGSCSTQQVVFERNTVGGSSTTNYSWSLYCSSNLWDVSYYNTNTSSWVTLLLGPVQIGQWQHLAFSFSTSTWVFTGCINGIATISQSVSNTTTFNATSVPVLVGGEASNSKNFKGKIDELKIWNSVRTGSQIASDMNTWGPIAVNNNLALYYDFNDFQPTTIFNKAWSTTSFGNLQFFGNYSTTDMKTTQSCALTNHTCISFERSYLNPFGGFLIPSTATTASIVVVAGGGGGSAQTDSTGWVGGGGGGGGYQIFNNPTLTPGSYAPVTVGAGGYGGVVAASGWGLGINGTNSQFGSLTASVGGGAGGGVSPSSGGTVNGASGGSGGGGGTYYTTTGGGGGAGTAGQGNVGGHALGTCCGSGGGGGYGGGGAYSTSATTPALGANGAQNPFYGSTYLAGGGNGAGSTGTVTYLTAASGQGSTATGQSASANTGAGGGGGGGGSSAIAAGFGGTGVVLFEYITSGPVVANPSSKTATAGVTTTFYDTNTVISGLTRTFVWQYSTNNGTSWNSAANGSATYGTPTGSAGSGQVLANGSYVTPTLTTAMSGWLYRVVVTDTDSFGVTSTTTTTSATLTVSPAISLTSSPGTATYGIANTGGSGSYVSVNVGTGTGPFTFTLNVPGSKYYLDTSTANSVSAFSSGFATLIATSASIGTLYETVTVTDASGATAQGIAVTAITPAPTTTSFTAGAAYYNLPDTLTATVISLSTLPVVGTVTFKDAANNILCSTSSFNAGVASCAWIPASTNPFNITAYFVDGAGNYASSQSSTSSVTPGKASITESVSASSAVVAGGSGASALIMTATLNPTGSATVGGSVAFTVNGVSACPSAVVSSSIATCSYSALGAGIQNISAVFSGDSTFNGANASTTTTVSLCNVTVTVNTYLTGAPGAGYCAVAFTSGTNGTWTVPTGVTNAQVLIVGGGGAGGERAGGGGGAGELLYTTTGTPLPLTSATDTITVGAGGQIETTGERGSVGGASSFATSTTYSAYGGGYGGGGGSGGARVCGATGGSSGGNDGGASYCTINNSATGHSSYSGFTSLVGNGAFGTDNNAGGNAEHWSGGGGGGAGSAGSAGVTSNSYTGSGTSLKYTTAGSGGSGASVAIALNSPSGCYAAGGGGGVEANSANNDLGNVAGVGGGCGATIIGGNGTAGGALSDGTNYATAGLANTGSGGGGSGFADNYISPNYMDGRAGAGGSGVVIVKYLSPSIITTNWDASGDTMTVTSGTSITLTETATVFSFTRATQWQYSTNNGTSWALETATATAGANSSSGNSNPTLSYTFAINCGLNTGLACAASSVKYLFRAVVTDTDTATNLVTTSYSPTITVNVTAKQPTQPLTVSSTVFSYAANTPFTLITSGGAGTGAITYALTTGGTASGCSITGAALRVTSPGTCKVIATQAADLDYLTQISSATPVNFYVFISYVGQYVAPVGSHGIGGQINGGGINSNQNSSTAFSVTGITPTRGAAGISIVVSGTGFETGTASNIIAVSFNSGLDIVSFVINSPTQMTLTVPAGESGVVDQFAIQPTTGPIVYTPNFTGL